MQHFHLSKRLKAIAGFVEPGERMADIGTDHAFIPIQLVQDGVIDFAIASDVRQGPLAIAKENIHAAGVADHIVLRLADGLAGIRSVDRISTVVIAGMGGQLMVDILEAGQRQLDGTETLILEANRDDRDVRAWLAAHDYGIVNEALVADEGHVYPIMVAGKTQPDVPYTEADLLLGPILRREASPLFMRQLNRRIKKAEEVLASLAKSQVVLPTKVAEQQHLLALLKEEYDGHRKADH